MKSFCSILVGLTVGLSCCLSMAADVVLPSAGKVVGVVRSDEPGKWIVLSQAGFLPVAPIILDGGKVCFFEGNPGSTYAVIKIPAGDGQPTVNTITLGGTPLPPGPGPGPNPPVDPPPTPLAGMRVLMIYESDAPLPKEVNDALRSPAVEDYLRAHCLKGPDAKTPERRRLDDDDPLTGLSKAWQDLRAKMPDNLPTGPNGFPIPQIAIGDSSGGVVFSGPVPPNDVALLELLKKYGGP